MVTIKKPKACSVSLDGPAIYVACLASYNNGQLHGYWIALETASTVKEIQECIDFVLATSPQEDAEEYAVHDSQMLPGFLARTECPDLEQIEQYMEVHNDLDDVEKIAYRICCNDTHQPLAEDDFGEMYCGVWSSTMDYCYSLAEDCGQDIDAAKWPFSCIDWDRAWRELEIDGYSAEFNSDAGGYIITRSV